MSLNSEYPFVSVIMPVRNEARHIADSVSAVLRQDYPQNRMEIIVADGLSDDETVEQILRLPEIAARVRIIRNDDRIQAAGLNRAIRVACGDILVRVDGHTMIAPDYVRACVETLQITQAWNAGGCISPIGITATGRAIALASRSPFAIPSTFRIGATPQPTDTVYMGAWPRRVFDEIGFFDEQFTDNEDYEHNVRIREAGGIVYFSPRICSEYLEQERIQALFRKYFRYGRSKPRTLLKHPHSLQLRQVVAPIFVIYSLLGGVLSALFPVVRPYWMLGWTFYLLSTLVFTLRAGKGAEPAIKIRIPIIFWVIHIAWGAGFLFAAALMVIAALRPKENMRSGNFA